MSKQQIQYAGGDESCGRRRVGLLDPFGGETHTQGTYVLPRSMDQAKQRGGMNEGKGELYCMYGMVTHIARVWINRVRLPVLHVVS